MHAILNDERGRMRALRRTGILDTPPQRSFDRIVGMAARIFGTPTALISFLDTDRQWFKARVGFAAEQTPRCDSLCNHTIRSAEVMVIENAAEDPRFANNPFVVGDAHLRFYAGAPLLTLGGYALGALCVIDTEPRRFTPEDARTLRELAELVMEEIELRYAAGRVDPTTFMPNRAQFNDDYADMMRDHDGQCRQFFLFDLDPVYVSLTIRALGISCFELFLSRLLHVTQDHLGESVRLYQLGPVSFGCVLPPDLTDAGAYAGAMIDVMRRPIDCAGIPLSAPVSAGLVNFSVGECSSENLTRMAFTAMHSARETRRRFSFFDADRDRAQRRAFLLVTDLATALRGRDQMEIYCQPQVSVETGQCVGAEILVRWHHPTLGSISPAEFIPLAEATDLIRPLTEWVIDASLAQAVIWYRAGFRVPISINISGRNLDEPDFVSRLGSALDRHGIPAGLVVLELTESALARNGEMALERLAEIYEMGVEIAIDDYGTGYTNLAYLQRVPARVLKLDKSVITALGTIRRDQTIVRSTVNMAHELGYRVIAEGVETKEIMTVISMLGCDDAQGYLFAKPMPVAAAGAWLAENSKTAKAAAVTGRRRAPAASV